MRTRWQTACHPCLQQRTRGNMLFDPTVRDVNPILFPARVRPMTELILTVAIHDKNVTMAESDEVSFIIRTVHLKSAEPPRLTETMSLASPHFPHRGSSSQCQPTHDFQSPIKVQVRDGWYLLLNTPRLHQGSNSPTQSSQQ